jgi:hypothetical protein
LGVGTWVGLPALWRGLVGRWGLGSGVASLDGHWPWFILGPSAHAVGASALVLGVG